MVRDATDRIAAANRRRTATGAGVHDLVLRRPRDLRRGTRQQRETTGGRHRPLRNHRPDGATWSPPSWAGSSTSSSATTTPSSPPVRTPIAAPTTAVRSPASVSSARTSAPTSSTSPPQAMPKQQQLPGEALRSAGLVPAGWWAHAPPQRDAIRCLRCSCPDDRALHKGGVPPAAHPSLKWSETPVRPGRGRPVLVEDCGPPCHPRNALPRTGARPLAADGPGSLFGCQKVIMASAGPRGSSPRCCRS